MGRTGCCPGCESSVCFRVPSLRSPRGKELRGFVLPCLVRLGGIRKCQICTVTGWADNQSVVQIRSLGSVCLGNAELRLRAEADKMICQSCK